MKNKGPISVRLEDDILKRLSELAKSEGISRSTLLNKAVKSFIQSYGAKQPDVSGLAGKVHELENKQSAMLNRLNIITKQVDFLIKRVNEAYDKRERNRQSHGDDSQKQSLARS